MKAIRVHQFGAPEVMTIKEAALPELGANQVLIRVKAVGINPVETYIRSGAYAALPPLPYTPGKDCAGIIEQVGANVKELRTGDRVFTSGSVTGTYAELTVCDSSDVHPLPDRVSFSQGAGVNTPYATAYRALFQKANARPGETVLVHGASGGVGTAAIQFARAAGLTVFGTASTERGQKLALEQGAHRVFNHHSPDYLQQIREATGGRGVNVILEMLANVNLGHDLTLLTKAGRVVVIGSRGKVEVNPRDCMLREASITGVFLFAADAEERREIYSAIITGLTNGTLNPIVGQELPLSQAARAHEAVIKSGAFGKIVLLP
ncbi:MAG: NADPH:quinone reductase [Limisphaerales bacterium]